ncbi:hypothetical protein INT46_006791 [Mucor plumbeus]|uniref:Uncharacterized protein n=1 Tax=Mucor plumbeus TaxID=97098 RepID=A0A8H7QFL4_9FUNG|nr:hypothetical protein INT46_006791 [Mucor plumbeus]
MKFTISSAVIFLFIVTTFLVELSEALSHPLDLIALSVDRHSKNVASFLIKRKSNHKNKNKKKNKKKSSDCSKRSCPMKLKPCPKDCPQSCGYLDSSDPCCPLLGKPTCPDY